MPGLLRGIARTAVVAGTASAVSGRVQRHQAQKWAGTDPRYPQPQQYAEAYQQAAPQPAPQPVPEQRSAPSTEDKLAQLKTLGELKAQGVLTEAEFEAQKAKILAG